MSEDYRGWLKGFDQDDHEKAAIAALEDLGRLNQRARELLLPILAEAVLMVRRQQARTIERSTPLSDVYSGESSVDQRRSRLEATFALPDGRRVTWEEATEQDHLDRVAYLQKHIAGVERTIDAHVEAVELIRSHGVSCLGEIGDAA